MGVVSDVVLLILGWFANILGAVIGLAIVIVAGKILFEISKDLLVYVWGLVHSESLKKFKEKRIAKREAKEKAKKQ